ncbi:MAG: radical SAM protein [Kiritimatiellae bacterium]|nr:radical SAM protein [Kiritimatiellia bacterium]
MGARRYLFGPVPSRRLGRSLGVDLTPLKTCTLNCVYCQLGHTPKTTMERRDYVPIADVLRELKEWKRSKGIADVITLAGSGEPTLHLHFGQVLKFVREELCLPSVLLTNGTLLHLDDVCRQAVLADVVKVTLSAWDEDSFAALHRPHSSVSFRQLMDGAMKFRAVFGGTFWVEVFLVEGINTSEEALRAIRDCLVPLHPDKIHLNTAVRPAAENGVAAVGEGMLRHALGVMGPLAEITASVPREPSGDGKTLSEVELFGLIERHPCSVEDLASVFGLAHSRVIEELEPLLRQQRIIPVERNGIVYYALPVLEK